MPNEETKYVVKRGDKYLKDGRYYFSDPVEVDNIAEARLFKTTQGARCSRCSVRKENEEFSKWADEYRKTGVRPQRKKPPFYHPTELKEGYSIVPVTIKATIQVEEK